MQERRIKSRCGEYCQEGAANGVKKNSPGIRVMAEESHGMEKERKGKREMREKSEVKYSSNYRTPDLHFPPARLPARLLPRPFPGTNPANGCGGYLLQLIPPKRKKITQKSRMVYTQRFYDKTNFFIM